MALIDRANTENAALKPKSLVRLIQAKDGGISDSSTLYGRLKGASGLAKKGDTTGAAKEFAKLTRDINDESSAYYKPQFAAPRQETELDDEIKGLVRRGYSDSDIQSAVFRKGSPGWDEFAESGYDRQALMKADVQKSIEAERSDPDEITARIYAARNGDMGSLLENLVASASNGSGDVPDKRSEASYDPASEYYHPYAHGATFKGGDDAAYANALEDTQSAKAELKSLDVFIREQLAKGLNADEIYEYLQAETVGENATLLQKMYPTLARMENHRQTGGALALTEEVDFALPYLKERINAIAEGRINADAEEEAEPQDEYVNPRAFFDMSEYDAPLNEVDANTIDMIMGLKVSGPTLKDDYPELFAYGSSMESVHTLRNKEGEYANIVRNPELAAWNAIFKGDSGLTPENAMANYVENDRLGDSRGAGHTLVNRALQLYQQGGMTAKQYTEFLHSVGGLIDEADAQGMTVDTLMEMDSVFKGEFDALSQSLDAAQKDADSTADMYKQNTATIYAGILEKHAGGYATTGEEDMLYGIISAKDVSEQTKLDGGYIDAYRNFESFKAASGADAGFAERQKWLYDYTKQALAANGISSDTDNAYLHNVTVSVMEAGEGYLTDVMKFAAYMDMDFNTACNYLELDFEKLVQNAISEGCKEYAQAADMAYETISEILPADFFVSTYGQSMEQRIAARLREEYLVPDISFTGDSHTDVARAFGYDSLEELEASEDFSDRDFTPREAADLLDWYNSLSSGGKEDIQLGYVFPVGGQTEEEARAAFEKSYANESALKASESMLAEQTGMQTAEAQPLAGNLFVTTVKDGAYTHAASWLNTYYYLKRMDSEQLRTYYAGKYTPEQMRDAIQETIDGVTSPELKAALQNKLDNSRDIYAFDFQLDAAGIVDDMTKLQSEVSQDDASIKAACSPFEYQAYKGNVGAINSTLFSLEALGFSAAGGQLIGLAGLGSAGRAFVSRLINAAAMSATMGLNEGAEYGHAALDRGESKMSANLRVAGIAVTEGVIESEFDTLFNSLTGGSQILAASENDTFGRYLVSTLRSKGKLGELASLAFMNTRAYFAALPKELVSESVQEIAESVVTELIGNMEAGDLFKGLQNISLEDIKDTVVQTLFSTVTQSAGGALIESTKGGALKRASKAAGAQMAAEGLQASGDYAETQMKNARMSDAEYAASVLATADAKTDPRRMEIAQAFVDRVEFESEVALTEAEALRAAGAQLEEKYDGQIAELEAQANDARARHTELSERLNDTQTAAQEAQADFENAEAPTPEQSRRFSEMSTLVKSLTESATQALETAQALESQLTDMRAQKNAEAQSMKESIRAEAERAVQENRSQTALEMKRLREQDEQTLTDAYIKTMAEITSKAYGLEFGKDAEGGSVTPLPWYIEQADILLGESAQAAFGDYAKTLAATQSQLATMIRNTWKGFKVVFADMGGRQGSVNVKGKQITLDQNATPMELLHGIVAHELMHIASKAGTQAISDLTDSIINAVYGDDTEAFRQDVADMQKRYADAGEMLDDAAAREEVLAELLAHNILGGKLDAGRLDYGQGMFNDWVYYFKNQQSFFASNVLEWLTNTQKKLESGGYKYFDYSKIVGQFRNILSKADFTQAEEGTQYAIPPEDAYNSILEADSRGEKMRVTHSVDEVLDGIMNGKFIKLDEPMIPLTLDEDGHWALPDNIDPADYSEAANELFARLSEAVGNDTDDSYFDAYMYLVEAKTGSPEEVADALREDDAENGRTADETWTEKREREYEERHQPDEQDDYRAEEQARDEYEDSQEGTEDTRETYTRPEEETKAEDTAAEENAKQTNGGGAPNPTPVAGTAAQIPGAPRKRSLFEKFLDFVTSRLGISEAVNKKQYMRTAGNIFGQLYRAKHYTGNLFARISTPVNILRQFAGDVGTHIYEGAVKVEDLKTGATTFEGGVTDTRSNAIFADNHQAAKEFAAAMKGIAHTISKQLPGLSEKLGMPFEDFLSSYMTMEDAEVNQNDALRNAYEQYLNYSDGDASNVKTLRAMIEHRRDQLLHWIHGSATDRIAAYLRVKNSTTGRWNISELNGFTGTLRQKITDGAQAAHTIDKFAGLTDENGKYDVKLDRAAHLAPYIKKRLIDNWYTGTPTDVDGNPTGMDSDADLVRRFKVKAADYDSVNQYWTALEARSRMEHGKNPFNEGIFFKGDGISVDIAPTIDTLNEVIKRIEKNHPNIAAYVRAKINWWDDYMQNVIVKEGLLTQSAYDRMKKEHPYYAPLKRYEDNMGSFFRAEGNSQAQIINPTESMRAMMEVFAERIGNNRVLRQFDEIYRQRPDMAFWAAKLDPITKDGKEYTPEGKDVVTLYNPNGSRTYYRIADDGIRAMFTGLTEMAGSVKEFLRPFTNLTRTRTMLATAANILFAAPNMFRDFQMSVNYGSWASNYLSGAIKWIASYIDIVKEDGLFGQFGGGKGSQQIKDYINMGGAGYTRAPSARYEARKALMKTVYNDAPLMKVKGVLLRLATAEDIQSHIETASRFAEYKYGKEATGVEGRTDRFLTNWGGLIGDTQLNRQVTKESKERAFMNSREVTVDFSRMGNSVVAVAGRSLVAFLNANIQGIDKTWRALTRKEERDRLPARAMKTVFNSIMTGMLSAFTCLQGRSDEEKDWYKNLKDEIKRKYILIPGWNLLDNTRHNDREYFRVPVTQDVFGQVFTEMGRKAMEDLLTEGKIEMFTGNGLLMDMLHSFIQSTFGDFSSLATVGTPVFEAWRNKNYYEGDIVKESLLKQANYNQFNKDTPNVYRKAAMYVAGVAQAIGVDINSKFLEIPTNPLKLQYVTEQYTGILGQVIKSMLSRDKATGETPTLLTSLRNLGSMAIDRFTIDADSNSVIDETYYNVLDKLDMLQSASSPYSNVDYVWGIDPNLTPDEWLDLNNTIWKANWDKASKSKGGAEITQIRDHVNEIWNTYYAVMESKTLSEHEKNEYAERLTAVRHYWEQELINWAYENIEKPYGGASVLESLGAMFDGTSLRGESEFSDWSTDEAEAAIGEHENYMAEMKGQASDSVNDYVYDATGEAAPDIDTDAETGYAAAEAASAPAEDGSVQAGADTSAAQGMNVQPEPAPAESTETASDSRSYRDSLPGKLMEDYDSGETYIRNAEKFASANGNARGLSADVDLDFTWNGTQYSFEEGSEDALIYRAYFEQEYKERAEALYTDAWYRAYESADANTRGSMLAEAKKVRSNALRATQKWWTRTSADTRKTWYEQY